MNNDLVSIIMLSHNNGRYVAESVRSVVNQTYQNWELIFMDDSSKDDTIRERQVAFMEENGYAFTYTKYKYIDMESKESWRYDGWPEGGES